MAREKSKQPTNSHRSGAAGENPIVVSADGVRHPFLRGMVTSDLMRRGLDFDRAYATADALRDRVRGRGEITEDELATLITEQIEELFGDEASAKLVDASPPTRLWILRQDGKQPFSRGVLARSILAAGVEFDRAYRVVMELHDQLVEEGITALPSQEIVRRIAELLREVEGKGAARRYQLVRRIPRLPRPMIVYLGGASGTGKSTLGFELAPLLRVYRVNSTDTVRQVMRMVFSPAILPSLHTSSFEIPGESLGRGEEALSSDPYDIDASFEEQSRRVLVGVRAVVERAIKENMSIVVEGVHLFPPLIPFRDLDGAAYQIPLLLGTLDVETHRSRFLTRARLGGRRAERYIENFDTIRSTHDWLLEQAETHDIPMLDTSDPSPPVSRALKIIVRQLQKSVPTLSTGAGQEEEQPPTLLLIIDGVADRGVRALGGRTPLQAATTPNLDRLASEGRTGLVDPVSPGVVADTAAGTLALFGQSPLGLKRGPVEALGAGLDLSPQDIALRGNLATVDEDGLVIDRRAGRIREESEALAKSLDRIPLPGSLADEIEIRVKAATEHRLAIAIKGDGLSPNIEGSDPGDGAVGQPLTPRPLDPSDSRAVRTASILALFERRANAILADHKANRKRAKDGKPVANSVLTRGAGRIHRLPALEHLSYPLRICCIAGDRTVLGLARWLGAEIHTAPEMTANLDTDLGAKFLAAAQALKRNDLVVVHVKGADIASHDQRPDLKVRYLEFVDAELGRLVEGFAGPLRVAVASDHATLSESGLHGADALPVLIWTRDGKGDAVDSFDETSVAAGSLRRFPLQMLIGKLFELG